MSWQAEWNRLKVRMDALLRTGRFMFVTSEAVGSDYYGTSASLIENGHQIVGAIVEFEKKYGASLPQVASARLLEFSKLYHAKFIIRAASGWSGMQGVVGLIGSFASEFDYLLSDTEAASHSLVDRAFMHLKRSLVADTVFAKRWQAAFAKGERECEKLGAAHLLLFGIYAFKADSAGERTDLILGGRVPTADVERGAETLVLTEWKLVRTQGDLPVLAEKAYEQARRYASGSLAGFELERYRYLVLVSKDTLDMPNDHIDGSVTYQYQNVAVAPSSPSKAR